MSEWKRLFVLVLILIIGIVLGIARFWHTDPGIGALCGLLGAIPIAAIPAIIWQRTPSRPR